MPKMKTVKKVDSISRFVRDVKPEAKRGRPKKSLTPPLPPAPVVEEPKEKATIMPIVSGVQVVEILPHGHTESQYHCRLSNGTTAHVAKSLFN